MPVWRLATHFEIISEISEPPKPKMTANTSRVPLLPRVMPNTFCSTLSTMLSSSRTAKLVARNNAMRLNMVEPFVECLGLAIMNCSQIPEIQVKFP